MGRTNEDMLKLKHHVVTVSGDPQSLVLCILDVSVVSVE